MSNKPNPAAPASTTRLHSEALNLRLPADIKHEIATLAAADRRKVSDYIRIVLEDHVAARQRATPAAPSRLRG